MQVLDLSLGLTLESTFVIICGQALGQNHDSVRLFILTPAVGALQSRALMRSVDRFMLVAEDVGGPSNGLIGYVAPWVPRQSV